MKHLEKYIASHLADIAGKKVIVTGANSGIGFSICDILLSKNATIVMACRSQKRASDARDALLKRHPDAKIEIILFDQSHLSAIKTFADIITLMHSDFYALILNAGVFRPDKKLLFEDYVPLTLGTNYLGPLYLISLLQPFLKKAGSEKRIIIQGSLAYQFNRYKGQDKTLLNTNNGLMKQYNLSKLGVTHLFYFYAAKNENPFVKYLLAEPGVSNTQIIRNFKKWFKIIARGFLSLVTHSNRKAALSACYLTTGKVANGAYIHPRGLLSINGYPRCGTLKEKHMDYRFIEDGLNILRYLEKKSDECADLK